MCTLFVVVLSVLSWVSPCPTTGQLIIHCSLLPTATMLNLHRGSYWAISLRHQWCQLPVVHYAPGHTYCIGSSLAFFNLIMNTSDFGADPLRYNMRSVPVRLSYRINMQWICDSCLCCAFSTLPMTQLCWFSSFKGSFLMPESWLDVSPVPWTVFFEQC